MDRKVNILDERLNYRWNFKKVKLISINVGKGIIKHAQNGHDWT